MKHTLLITLFALMLGGAPLRVLVLTPTPQMHCDGCENKIKKNMRFENGVKKIETNIERQEVTITYDPKKTDSKKLQACMKKIGYDTRVVSDKEQTDTKAKKSN